MGVLKTLWGLLVDDARLVIVLGIALVVAFAFSRMHLSLLAAAVIWLGLLAGLWLSVGHQLELRRARDRSKPR